jgi:hypothetical protein
VIRGPKYSVASFRYMVYKLIDISGVIASVY